MSESLEIRPHFQTRFDIAEFRRRREALSNAIDGHAAVVGGLPASGAMDPFRQDNVFFYLSGVEVPHSYLVIGKAGESTLYLPPVDKRLAEIEGPELDAEDQALTLELTGFDHVKPLTALSSDLRAESVLYTPRDSAEGRRACQDSLSDSRRRAERDPWQRSQPTLASLLHARLGPIELRDLSPAVARLRRFKSSVEMEALREAGQITAFAVKEAIRSTQPGLVEYQLAALAEYTFTLNGAAGGAYQPIVASGSNIWNIHYARNNCRLQGGDLVLMDYAPDLNYYTSDIGRMWPVNGVYSKEQRETLSLIVDYHQTLLDLIGPGMTARELRDLAADKLRPIVSRTKWSSEPVKNAVETLLATSRACTHDVGMAVHDSSGYQPDDETLEPGMVFALDPQFWIPEHRLYQRVEDNIAITSDGVENFTSDAPIALDQIEQLMLEPGILQRDTHLLAGPRSELDR